MGKGILTRNSSGEVERIGDIRLSTRDSLGEKWALADGTERPDGPIIALPDILKESGWTTENGISQSLCNLSNMVDPFRIEYIDNGLYRLYVSGRAIILHPGFDDHLSALPMSNLSSDAFCISDILDRNKNWHINGYGYSGANDINMNCTINTSYNSEITADLYDDGSYVKTIPIQVGDMPIGVSNFDYYGCDWSYVEGGYEWQWMALEQVTPLGAINGNLWSMAITFGEMHIDYGYMILKDDTPMLTFFNSVNHFRSFSLNNRLFICVSFFDLPNSTLWFKIYEAGDTLEEIYSMSKSMSDRVDYSFNFYDLFAISESTIAFRDSTTLHSNTVYTFNIDSCELKSYSLNMPNSNDYYSFYNNGYIYSRSMNSKLCLKWYINESDEIISESVELSSTIYSYLSNIMIDRLNIRWGIDGATLYTRYLIESSAGAGDGVYVQSSNTGVACLPNINIENANAYIKMEE